ncbi:hypothetical protein Tco_0001307 [Tanacetum coccineum]
MDYPRVKISSTNIRLETIVRQKEETFQVVIDLIKNSTHFKAFTISADVSEIFMQQFWYSIKKVQGTDSYEFLLANKKCTVNAEVFRTILDICPRVEGVDFINVLDNDNALTFLIDLSYKGALYKHTNFLVIISPAMENSGSYNQQVLSGKTTTNKQSESYQMFIKYSTGQIRPKKSRGKSSQGKKIAENSQETVDVFEESEPERIENLTQDILLGPTFNLLKGTCSSSIELEYNFQDCFNALQYKLDWNNPEGDRYPFDLSKPLPLQGPLGHRTVAADYFYNNDLEYLNTSDPEVTYTTSIMKTKAAWYEIKGIEDMAPTL